MLQGGDARAVWREGCAVLRPHVAFQTSCDYRQWVQWMGRGSSRAQILEGAVELFCRAAGVVRQESVSFCLIPRQEGKRAPLRPAAAERAKRGSRTDDAPGWSGPRRRELRAGPTVLAAPPVQGTSWIEPRRAVYGPGRPGRRDGPGGRRIAAPGLIEPFRRTGRETGRAGSSRAGSDGTRSLPTEKPRPDRLTSGAVGNFSAPGFRSLRKPPRPHIPQALPLPENCPSGRLSANPREGGEREAPGDEPWPASDRKATPVKGASLASGRRETPDEGALPKPRSLGAKRSGRSARFRLPALGRRPLPERSRQSGGLATPLCGGRAARRAPPLCPCFRPAGGLGFASARRALSMRASGGGQVSNCRFRYPDLRCPGEAGPASAPTCQNQRNVSMRLSSGLEPECEAHVGHPFLPVTLRRGREMVLLLAFPRFGLLGTC